MRGGRRGAGRMLPAAPAHPAPAAAGTGAAPGSSPAAGADRPERQAILDVLHSNRFADVAPAEV